MPDVTPRAGALYPKFGHGSIQHARGAYWLIRYSRSPDSPGPRWVQALVPDPDPDPATRKTFAPIRVEFPCEDYAWFRWRCGGSVRRVPR
ncbi:hypothetical protein GCM10010528_21550 [Gordonia defluvii]|uniref:Uncharacterized protein n=1 Tax=Gordonia defluvii TaxID=283718 RepID=A0ABP6LGP7_9ACTN